MNKVVNYKLAKLLKEKGFDENCRFGYNGSYEPHHIGLIEFGYLQRNSELIELTYCAPTIAQVVMWLYEKHRIWIYPLPINDDMKLWKARIIKGEPFNKLSNTLRTISHCKTSYSGIHSPTEAYEEAIEYCSTKLI